MITSFIGAPGCGKSTALAWVARRATRKRCAPISICGHLVSSGHTQLFTNFPFSVLGKEENKSFTKILVIS